MIMSLDAVMVWLSDWGWIVPAVCILSIRDKKTILASIIALIVTYGVSDLIKGLSVRPRPFAIGQASLVGEAAGGWSFPSKHASLAFSVATSAYLGKRVLGIVALVFAALIAYSRVYLGVHYWSDIFVGAAIGAAIAFGTDRAMDYWTKRAKKKKGIKRRT